MLFLSEESIIGYFLKEISILISVSYVMLLIMLLYFLQQWWDSPGCGCLKSISVFLFLVEFS